MKEAVALPVIGLRKRRVPGSDVYITPELEDARAVAAAGADIVAVDATLRPRPDGVSLAALVSRAAGARARRRGLPRGRRRRPGSGRRGGGDDAGGVHGCGAPGASPGAADPSSAAASPGPDLDLVRALAAELDCPVLAEGRIATPEQARAAFDAGAFAVVVGTAITDPVALTRASRPPPEGGRMRRAESDGLPASLPADRPKGEALREILEGLVASLGPAPRCPPSACWPSTSGSRA